MIQQFFPTVILVLQALSAVPYFWAGDWRMGFYWLFAFGLTLVVTY